MQKDLKTEVAPRIKIDTPIGSIESDSGNHIIDGVTVVVIIAVVYIFKRIIDKVYI